MDNASEKTQANALALKMAQLFAAEADSATVKYMTKVDGDMSHLMKMIDTEVRIEIAKRLSDLRRAPEKTVIVLANDEPDVAETILTKSTVLTADEIIKIARSKGKRHQMAIARRDLLPASVSDILIQLGDRDVKVEVASNKSADISREGFRQLLETAREDVGMQEALADRHDLCDEDIFTLVSIAVLSIQRRLIARGALDHLSMLPEASLEIAAKMANDYWLGRYDFESAFEKVAQMASETLLREQDIRSACLADRFAEAVAIFSFVTRTEFEKAKTLLIQMDTDPFIETAKSSRVQISTVMTLLKSGPWKHRLTDDVRQEIEQDYRRFSMRSVPMAR